MMSQISLVSGVGHVKVERASAKVAFSRKARSHWQNWLLMLHLWSREYPVTDAEDEVEIGRRTAVDTYISVVQRGLHNKAPSNTSNPWWTRCCCAN